MSICALTRKGSFNDVDHAVDWRVYELMLNLVPYAFQKFLDEANLDLNGADTCLHQELSELSSKK